MKSNKTKWCICKHNNVPKVIKDEKCNAKSYQIISYSFTENEKQKNRCWSTFHSDFSIICTISVAKNSLIVVAFSFSTRNTSSSVWLRKGIITIILILKSSVAFQSQKCWKFRMNLIISIKKTLWNKGNDFALC